MARTIVVTSGKGGVGKTTITYLLGKELALLNYKVVLFDADFGLKNLDVIMGLESRIIYDLDDVIKSRATLRQALIEDKDESNLFLLPSWTRITNIELDESIMNKIILNLQKDFDFILIDCPSGVDKGFYNAIKHVKESIVVLTLDKTSLKASDKVVGLLKSNNIEDIKVIINKRCNHKYELKETEVRKVMDVPIIGSVSYDKNIPLSQNYGKEVPRVSKSSIDIYNISNRLLGKESRKQNYSFIQRLIKKHFTS